MPPRRCGYRVSGTVDPTTRSLSISSEGAPLGSVLASFAFSALAFIVSRARTRRQLSPPPAPPPVRPSPRAFVSSPASVYFDAMAGQSRAPAPDKVLTPEEEAAAAARKQELQRRGTWQGSVVTEEHIRWARKSRRIPSGVAHRIPPAGEITPAPRKGEWVIFLSHLQRGFGFPASNFFESFLRSFKLQPHHLPPNVFIFLSAYVALFEGYLGIWPSLHHWRHYFNFRAQTVQGLDIPDKPLVPCGAASVIPRRGTSFFRVPGAQTAHKWQCTYFYVSNKSPEDLINLPAYVAGTPDARKGWSFDFADMLVRDV